MFKETFLAFCRKRLAWPSLSFFYCYATISGALIAFLLGSILLTPAQAPANPTSFGDKAALAAVLALINAGALALIYLMLAVYYRMLLDFFESVRRFRAWLPGARQRSLARLKSSAEAVKNGIASLRLPTAAEIGFSLLLASAFAVIFAVGWFFWPVATRLSLSIPSWLPGSAKSNADIFEILLVDFFISCVPAAIALSLWAALVKAVVKQVQRFNK